jgi:hypothetical protein
MRRLRSDSWPVLAVLLTLLGGTRALAQPAINLPGGDAVVALGGDVLTSDRTAVYRSDATAGALIQTYPAPLGVAAAFGHSLAVVAGSKILVGAPGAFPTGGAAYLYDAATGSLLLSVDAGPTFNQFGWSVADLGGNLLVGAPGDDTDAQDAGAVYLFDGTTGALIRVFHHPTPAASAEFGTSVAALGGDVLVGAPTGNFNLSPGAAFRLDAATGAVLRTFTAPTPTVQDLFGTSVAAFGTDVLVGAPGEAGRLGAVHLLDGATGALVRTFSGPPSTGRFGVSLAVDGSLILAGANGYSDRTESAFMVDGTTGAILRTLGFPRGTARGFGLSLAVVNGNAVVASPAVFFSGERGANLFCGGTTGCGPCETCGPLGGCTVAPNPTCRAPLPGSPAVRPHLRLKNLAADAGDSVLLTGKWSIPTGAGDPSGDFALPDTTQDYTLCLYDESGMTPSLVFRATAPAGGTCGTAPCWKRRFPYQGLHTPFFRGFRYSDQDRTPEGLRTIVLQTDVDPFPCQGCATLKDSHITLKGTGALLSNRPGGLPSLPLPLPLRAQLQAEDGMCWDGVYSSAGVTRNTTAVFDGKAD